MPRKSKKKIDLSAPKNNDPEDLRVFIAEAEQVDLLTRQPGWEIISRDINEYRDSIGCRLAYTNPNTKEYDDARILYIASDKLIKLIEDYSRNKEQATELLQRLEHPEENIILDVDSE